MSRLWPVLLTLCLPALAPAAGVGQSPYIYGMHDMPDASLLAGPPGCAKGWVTELRYIGSNGTCGAGDIDYQDLSDQGYGIIMRLDHDGDASLPTDPARYDGYATAFADCVARSSGVRVWVVGNEPNIAWGGHVFSPGEVSQIYRRVVAAVAALPDGAGHQVLFPAMAPWASVPPWGDWDDGLAAAIDDVLANGGQVPGVAVHAYTREFSVGAISSDAWFPGREGKWHLHFRAYRDTLGLLAARGLTDIPLYITEAGNACDPPCDPYPDQDLGYFVAMYDEIHAWNQDHPGQIVRAVTPYRWTSNDDGSGRDFCIGCSGPLVTDLQHAIAKGQLWDPAGCADPDDADGDGHSPPDDCDDGDPEVYPGAPEVCGNGRDEDCNGADAPCPTQQAVAFWHSPDDPAPGQAVVIQVFGHQGYTNVALMADGPAPVAPSGAGIDGSCNQDQRWVCHWDYTATFGQAGTWLLSFVADPDQTVYGTHSLRVGDPPNDQDEDGISPPDDCDDADPSVHPGATDTCGDGVDQDCDGLDAPCEEPDAGPGDGDAGPQADGDVTPDAGDPGEPDGAQVTDDADPAPDELAGGCNCGLPGGGSAGRLGLLAMAMWLLFRRRNR